MRNIIITSLILLIFIFTLGCEPTEEVIEDLLEDPCKDYTGDHLIMCEAGLIYEDLSFCEEVVSSRFKEECVVVVAEVIYDESQVDYCDISDVYDNQMICEALMMEDIDLCFEFDSGEGLGASLTVRDCIDLVSRKMRDVDLCEYFESEKSLIYDICGETGDCEGQWLEPLGITDNIESCQYSVEEAIEYDLEN